MKCKQGDLAVIVPNGQRRKLSAYELKFVGTFLTCGTPFTGSDGLPMWDILNPSQPMFNERGLRYDSIADDLLQPISALSLGKIVDMKVTA